MSLVCGETRKAITFGSPLHAVTSANNRINVPISQEALNLVPVACRQEQLCRGPGFNVYAATSNQGHGDQYAQRDFSRGDFVFSVTCEDARRYLPTIMRRYERAEADLTPPPRPQLAPVKPQPRRLSTLDH